jgi:hypothetical protein
VAVYCSVNPVVIEALAGVTAMDFSVGAVTVSVVEPVIELEVAVIVVVPVAIVVASPLPPMVAAPALLEVHLTEPVMFCVVPLLKVPVAVYCTVPPAAIEALAGVTAIDCSVAPVIVSRVEPVMEPEVAVMVVVPVARAFANPPVLMVAAVALLELQVTELVRFCVVPLL